MPVPLPACLPACLPICQSICVSPGIIMISIALLFLPYIEPLELYIALYSLLKGPISPCIALKGPYAILHVNLMAPFEEAYLALHRAQTLSTRTFSPAGTRESRWPAESFFPNHVGRSGHSTAIQGCIRPLKWLYAAR